MDPHLSNFLEIRDLHTLKKFCQERYRIREFAFDKKENYVKELLGPSVVAKFKKVERSISKKPLEDGEKDVDNEAKVKAQEETFMRNLIKKEVYVPDSVYPGVSPNSLLQLKLDKFKK